MHKGHILHSEPAAHLNTALTVLLSTMKPAADGTPEKALM
jgi:hypothetical protein